MKNRSKGGEGGRQRHQLGSCCFLTVTWARNDGVLDIGRFVKEMSGRNISEMQKVEIKGN